MARPDPVPPDHIPAEQVSSESLRIRAAARSAAARALLEHRAAGRPVYYGDPEYPGFSVKELPDGRRFLTRRGASPNYQGVVVRQIPPR